MRLTFLEADRPLAKSYSRAADGALIKDSYPHVWEFTSHDVEVTTLTEFYDALIEHAALGHCLLKGEAQRPLSAESRAGSTDPNALTSWICLDVDRLGPGATISDLLRFLGLSDLSHIIQYSASYGIEPERGETGHVFILLDRPVHPASLKQWLIGLNLSTSALSPLISLTKTNNALSWPLDVSTCQSDKLLYIAPPVLGPGVDVGHQTERIRLVSGKHESLSVGSLTVPTVEANRAASNARLDVLRAAMGLPKRAWTYKTTKDGEEVLARPDAATLSGLKRERGFTYFNLNGGDSWGYFHNDNTPTVIRNFKGEPDYLTAELLPEYWAQHSKTMRDQVRADKAIVHNPTASQGKSTLVFRDFRTATYYNGTWDPDTQHLNLARASSETQIQHFLKEKGLPETDFIPTWNLLFDPQSDVRVDAENRTINTFEQSSYMKLPPANEIPSPDAFPRIMQLLRHCVGDDDALLEHFLNWWACIYQYRDRTMISWILHGLQGTGKGLLVNKVFIPLLGAGVVTVKRMKEFEEQFNEYLERSLLVVIDEAQISESRQGRMLMASLKNMITEPQLSIRRMRTDSYLVRNYCNFLLLSNMPDPATVEISDRRFNVGKFQDAKLDVTQEFLDDIETELEAFAQYSKLRIADRRLAMTIFENADRSEMIATSTNSIDATAHALLHGDLEFFWDALPAGAMGMLSIEAQALHDDYEKIVTAALASEGPHRITREEIRVLFAYNIGDVPRTPAKFTSMLRHHRVPIVPIWVHGKTCRGMELTWKKDPTWTAQRLQELSKDKVTPLRKAG